MNLTFPEMCDAMVHVKKLFASIASIVINTAL